MEFFLELALTISLPLLISFVIARLLSKDPADEELASFGFDLQFGSRIRDPKSDKTSVVVEDFVNDDGIGCPSKQGKSTVVESRDETGSKCDVTVIEPVGLVGERKEEDFNNGGGGCGRESGENVIDENSIRARHEETGINQDEKDIPESDEDEVLGCDRSKVSDGVKEGRSVAEVIDEDDDDWEGIERTELEKLFDAAVECVRINDGKNSTFGSELKMQLCGLQKIAMEGPCREPPPMVLKISARAKWNAWRQLGNMTPEAAMEFYINLVSENIPGWTPKIPGVNDEQDASRASKFGKLASETEPL